MMFALLTGIGDGDVHWALHTVTVCGAGHEKTVDQAVWVMKTVSVVPLDTNAVVALSKKATANPKMSCILNTEVTAEHERESTRVEKIFLLHRPEQVLIPFVEHIFGVDAPTKHRISCYS